MRNARRARHCSIAAPCGLAAVLFACGADDDSGSPGGADAFASFEGIYELTARSEDDAGCEDPGVDLMDSTNDLYFVLVSTSVLGTPILTLTSCADVAACRERADAIRNQQSYPVEYSATLSRQVSGDVLGGFTAWSGREENGMCVEREYDDHVLTRTGNTVTLETRVKGLADKPPEDGFCMASPREDGQEAATAPCVAMSLVAGERVDDL